MNDKAKCTKCENYDPDASKKRHAEQLKRSGPIQYGSKRASKVSKWN